MADIISATLYLYAYAIGYSAGRTYRAYRLLRLDWVETQATWNIYKTGSNWTTPGAGSDGNDHTTVGGANAIVPASADWMSWNVLAQVQWAQANSAQVAFLIKDSDDTTYGGGTDFFSREYTTDITLRPALVIEYTTGSLTFQPSSKDNWLKTQSPNSNFGTGVGFAVLANPPSKNRALVEFLTFRNRSYTVRQNDERGKPIFLAECKAYNKTTGALIDTKYTDNGLAVFDNLPFDDPVDIEVRWDKQYRLYENVYEASGGQIETLVDNSHVQNTDDYVKGVPTTPPGSPTTGMVYSG